jgi:hypothetical protein
MATFDPTMLGMAPGVSKMTQEEEDEMSFKMADYISKMDPEIRDRFKALMAISNMIHEEEQKEEDEIKKLELEFED